MGATRSSYYQPERAFAQGVVVTETALRTFGGLLQVAGVVLVAWELDAAVGEYAPMHSAVRRNVERFRRARVAAVRFVRRLFGRLPEPIIVRPHPATIRVTAGSPTVTQHPPDRDYDDFTTDEERIRYLFARADSAKTRIGALREQTDRDRRNARKRMDKLEAKLTETDQAWRVEVKELKAGNAGRRFAGFATVGYGIVAATWAVELARWELSLAVLLVAWLSTVVWAVTRPQLPE